ncbi:ferrous iron transporter B [Porphyrobacter sp. GA68]|uniref:ferrous iron transporter B n=1 Tax=Porphyrobacter sp. GA68 TaxID=2883480 RepID=UPI001D181248|nr:ferrous iron transporter B [Porphyrobacter sp. GA68]
MTRLRRAVLVGNPNAGKSALFNKLTGARQKIANYPGVTVERKAGRMILPSGEPMELVDLPGAYSLDAASPDEAVTRDVLLGRLAGEARPDLVILVLDANNLEQHLVFAQEVLEQGLPVIAALNMVDLAERDGLTLDAEALGRALGVPVIPTVAVRRRGLEALREAIGTAAQDKPATHVEAKRWHITLPERRLEARHMANAAVLARSTRYTVESKLDQLLLNPWAGPVVLFGLLFVMFQAVFAWATPFADALDSGVSAIAGIVGDLLPEGFLRAFLIEGVFAGVGSVVVFLPQIVILFAFILVMEASGYMARAAFLMDRMMARVGLSGRSFIPLLSSFACAIPGIMATRAIADEKDRLTTILVAPLMTCSARLPVYAVVIAAVIPNTVVGGVVGLQGLVLFCLYLAGIVGAMVVALVLRRSVTRGSASGFIMELPRYQWPVMRDLAMGLWQRAWVFLRRAGTIIFAATIVLWLLLSFPRAAPGESQVDASIAGRIGNGIAVVVEPIGFNRDIAMSLIPALAAREVAVSSLGTIYAVDAENEDVVAAEVTERIAAGWTLPTALAFLAWFVFAPQCLSTIAVARRETNGWKWPLFMVAYLFGLAYIFAGLTYWSALALGL